MPSAIWTIGRPYLYFSWSTVGLCFKFIYIYVPTYLCPDCSLQEDRAQYHYIPHKSQHAVGAQLNGSQEAWV